MNFRITTFFLIVFFCFAGIADAQVENVFSKNDPDFEVKDIPSKWQQESAVIICQSLTYKFDRKNGKILDKETVRRRIKLLDKSAINEFSEFYFVSTENIGINVIKSDGKVNSINLKDAVLVSEEIEIPSIFRSNVRSKREYKKLAIPGLEVNDIIDYYYIAEDKRPFSSFEFAFPEILISLPAVYPAIKQKIEFHVENGFKINFKNQNGSGQIKEIPGTEEGIKVFYFEDTDRDKLSRERWSYVYRNTPTIKFQVIYTNKKKSDYFIGENGIPKTSVLEAEILEKVHDEVFIENSFISQYKRYLGMILKDYKRTNKVKAIPAKEIAYQVYYLFRHYRYYNPLGLAFAADYDKGDNVLFIKSMVAALRYYKVDFKIMLAAPVEISDLADVILKEELLWIAKVEDEKLIYLFPPYLHGSFNEIPESFEGVNAYEIKIDQDLEKSTIKKSSIPKNRAEDHFEHTKMKVSLDSTLTNFKIDRNVTASGVMKDNHQYMIEYFEVANSEFNDYKSYLYPYYYTFGTVSLERTEKHVTAVKDKLKRSVEEEFTLVSYGDYSLNSKGRGLRVAKNDNDMIKENTLRYEESFTIKGLLKKAGNNYFFEAGKLIGGQVEIAEKEMDRKYNVNYHPRSYKCEIVFQIPEGYTLEGVENLNIDVTNETGGFTSKAVIEGNTLVINTTKVYAHNFEKKEDWKKVVDFLNAANKFTQVKILMKKK